MNPTQEAVLNRFPYGRFEVFTTNLHLRRLDAKRAKRVLRQYREGLLMIKDNGEVGMELAKPLMEDLDWE